MHSSSQKPKHLTLKTEIDFQFGNRVVLVDKVSLSIYSFGFQCPSENHFNDLITALIRKLFRIENSPFLSAKLVIRKDGLFSGRGKLSYNASTKIAWLKVDLNINPTRYQRSHLLNARSQSHSSTDYTLDGNDNFIPHNILLEIGPEEIGGKNIFCFQRLILDFVTQILVTTKPFTPFFTRDQFPRVSVKSIELYWDILCPTPLKTVLSLRSSFASLFRQFQSDNYDLKRYSTVWCQNSVCLKGRSFKGEDYKVYAKTCNTIRFECVFSKCRVQALLKSNVFDPCDIYSITSLIENLAQHCSETFLALQPEQPQSFQADRLIYLIRHFIRATRPTSVIDVLTELVSVGRLLSTQDNRKLVYKLHNEGILIKSNRGHYRINDNDRLFLSKFLAFLVEHSESNSIGGAPDAIHDVNEKMRIDAI